MIQFFKNIEDKFLRYLVLFWLVYLLYLPFMFYMQHRDSVKRNHGITHKCSHYNHK